MHSVGADEQKIGTGRFNLAGRLGQQLTGTGPIVVMLHRLNFLKVNTHQHQPGRVQPS